MNATPRGAAAIENCSCHSLRGSSTTANRSIIRSVCLAVVVLGRRRAAASRREGWPQWH